MARRKKTTKSTDKGIPLIDLTAEPDINQVNESLEKVDELLTTSYEEEELKLSDHINKSVTNPDGVHNFRYDLTTKKLQYKTGTGTWTNMDLESTGTINTSELTAENIKQGVTVTITRGTQELKKVVGTYTGDATATAQDIISGKVAYAKGNKITGTYTPSTLANMTNDATATAGDLIKGKTAYVKGNKITGTLVQNSLSGMTGDATAYSSDILSGKTAYARGSKITGNISTYSGDRSVSSPSVSGSYVYTPTVSNGYYSNARFYFSKGNLSPENIKSGVNIFGVTGSLDSSNSVLGVLAAAFVHRDGESFSFSLNSSYFSNLYPRGLQLLKSTNLKFLKKLEATGGHSTSFNYSDGYYSAGSTFYLQATTSSTGTIKATVIIVLA